MLTYSRNCEVCLIDTSYRNIITACTSQIRVFEIVTKYCVKFFLHKTIDGDDMVLKNLIPLQPKNKSCNSDKLLNYTKHTQTNKYAKIPIIS